jgi:hypothetical protein
VPGCHRSPEAALTVFVGTAFATGAAIETDPAINASTSINFVVLDSIAMYPLRSIALANSRLTPPNRSQSHNNYFKGTPALRTPKGSGSRKNPGPTQILTVLLASHYGVNWFPVYFMT